jgi:AraC-like DNA-binding protein
MKSSSIKPYFSISSFIIDNNKNKILSKKCCYYEIYFIQKGNGKHIIDLIDYIVEDGMIFFVSPSQSDHWYVEKKVEGIKIEFSESFLKEISCGILQELSFLDGNYFCVKLENNQKCEYLLSDLLKEFNQNRFGKNVALRSYLILVLIGIQRSIDDLKIPNIKKIDNEYIWSLKKLIRENQYKNETVEYYANKLGISADYLNKVIKSNYNKTASNYLREQTILEAQKLLAYSDDTVESISEKLGFVDISYFRRFFKRETSMTATEYRSYIRDKYPIMI